MKLLILAAFAAAAVTPAMAAPAKTHPAKSAGARSPAQVAREFVSNANTGKIKELEALFAPGAVMVDEFAPYAWGGADAVQRWGADFGVWQKANEITNDQVRMGAVTTSEISGDSAYLVAAASETYQAKGKTVFRPARFTFAFHRDGGDWKITAMSWAAGKIGEPRSPKRAAAAAAAGGVPSPSAKKP